VRKTLVILSVVLILLTTYVASASAQEINLPDQRIYPDSIFYPVKRGWEKLREKISFSDEARQKYNLTLFRKRTSELNYVTENKLGDDIETSSGRVAASAGVVADSVSAEGFTEKEQGLIAVFEEYTQYLGVMRDRYPSGTAEWRFVQQDIDTLYILSSKIIN
jgi:hypothetical protein